MDMEKTIFRCRIGSHLYGTNRPSSDEDFAGVKLHTVDHLLGIHNRPRELNESVKLSDGPRNTKGDTDSKYYFLPRFLELAAQGQPGQLEMLFAPPEMVVVETEEWAEIKKNLELFRSKNGITPFLGFAASQAHKAAIKGENLNLIRDVLKWGEKLSNKELLAPLKDHFILGQDQNGFTAILKPIVKGESSQERVKEIAEYLSDGPVVKYYVNEHGFPQVRIAGRDFDIGARTKDFLNALGKLEARYGTRVLAAAENKFDFKSLGHAVRLLGEAEEFLETGRITLPRPDREEVKRILKGEVDPEFDWFDYIHKRIDKIELETKPKSTLPDKPDWNGINKLCIELQKRHLDL